MADTVPDVAERDTPAGLDPTALQSDVSAVAASSRSGRDRARLARGTTLARYEIIGHLGDGGMGSVYAAHDPKLDRDVAIKVLHTAGIEATRRLEREAQALAKLEHPNVVAVYDSGEHGDVFFIVMQLVHGDNLARELQLRRRTPAQILALFDAAGRGLAAAHAAGIIHRDFKPANVLVDRSGRVAVTDFGLARGAEEADLDAPAVVPASGPATIPSVRPSAANWSQQQLTEVGAVMGTPAYMSPEQHRGASVSAASDQFAFCVALWEALYGQHPFITAEWANAPSPFACGAAILEGAIVPPPPGTRVAKRVHAALRRGLAGDPAARWPSMTALLDHLTPTTRRRGLGLGVAALAAAAGALGVWAAADSADAPSCDVTAAARVDALWSPATRSAMRARFVATGQPFAERAATVLDEAVAGYAAAWRQLAVDACLTARDAARTDAVLQSRRAACLDRALADLRSLAQVVTGPASVETVEHADKLVRSLPPLAACADAEALLAGPGAPPPALAPRIEAAQQRLATANIAYAAAQYVTVQAQVEALAPDVAALGWPPLEVELALLRGSLAIAMGRPATDDVIAAAQRAVELRMDTTAATAWALAMESAALARDARQQRTLEAMAIATARRAADPPLLFDVYRARARSLVHLRQWNDALAACRTLEPLVAQLPANQDLARFDVLRCQEAALVPLDRWTELEPLLARELEFAQRHFGEAHPIVGAILASRATFFDRTGKHAEGRAAIERTIAIRTRAYGPHGELTLDASRELMKYDIADKQLDQAEARGRQLLEVAATLEPPRLALLYKLHRDLGLLAQRRANMPIAQREFETAIGYATQLAGATSQDAAILMVMAGQYKSKSDPDGGIALLRRAADALDAVGDKRAHIARAGEALIHFHQARYADAVPIYERVLAALDTDAEPTNFGLLRFQLARCLHELRRDPARVDELLALARADFVRAGAPAANQIERLDKFIRTLRRGRR